jgi:SAM-dependent methyltransferase
MHAAIVHQRRAAILAKHIGPLLPTGAAVLDLGCGDGRVASMIARQRPDLRLVGMDVAVRSGAEIHVEPFDGVTVPAEDQTFDAVMLVDVLHHTEDPMVLLAEARRVTRDRIVLKDHTLEGVAAASTLRLMDWWGNARHGVSLPYNYWSWPMWEEAFLELRCEIAILKRELALYPPPATWLCDRLLHFVAELRVPADATSFEASR